MANRYDIVETVRNYKDTPFAHMQRTPGIGLDCAGVLICAGRDLGLVAPDFDVPPYTQQPDGHSMLEWLQAFMGAQVSRANMQVGDAVVIRTDVDPQHLGVLGDYPYGGFSIIHAANNATPPRVLEQRLMWARNQGFVAAFRFPGIA